MEGLTQDRDCCLIKGTISPFIQTTLLRKLKANLTSFKNVIFSFYLQPSGTQVISVRTLSSQHGSETDIENDNQRWLQCPLISTPLKMSWVVPRSGV